MTIPVDVAKRLGLDENSWVQVWVEKVEYVDAAAVQSPRRKRVSFCIYCGRQLSSNDRFCDRCGKLREAR